MRPWRNRRLQILFISLVWLCVVVTTFLYVSLDEPDHTLNYTTELLWWTPDMNWPYDENRECGSFTCRITNNREHLPKARVILFYGSNMQTQDFPLPRLNRHLWALLHEESPRNVPYVPYDEFLRHFNYTGTFSRYSDFPLTTQYLPQASDLIQRDYHNSHFTKQILQFNGDLAPIVFLQTDCNTMSGREDYVRELMKHIKIDSYGGCLHNRDLPESLQKDYLNNLFSPKILRFLSKYKFMLSIENAACDDYITEKFWRPFIIGVVPIYFGSPTIREWQPMPRSAVYIDDFADARALAHYLSELGDNETEYSTYVEHKEKHQRKLENHLLLQHLISRRYSIRNTEMGEEHSLIHRFECFVCREMHLNNEEQHADKRHYDCPFPPKHVPLQNKKEPKYAEDWRAMMALGHCQAKLLDDLWQANIPYTNDEFENRLSEMINNGKCH